MYKPQGSISLETPKPEQHNIYSNNLQVSNNNTEVLKFSEEIVDNIETILNDNKEINNSTLIEINSNEVPDTTLMLTDNYKNKLKTIENFRFPENITSIENARNKKRETYIDDNLNCSTNSLVSDNLSSPMQTSTDLFLDSEIFSTDAASNDSHSPKNIQNVDSEKNETNSLLEVKRFNEFCLNYKKSNLYGSNENFSNPKSDQSLLNSADSCDSSPIHKLNRDYKKISKKYKNKKHFGVKTLQSIFNRHDGYSDISSTASECGEEILKNTENNNEPKECTELAVYKANPLVSDVSPQFEQNLHSFLSETFSKNYALEQGVSSITINKSTGSKKYFKLNGQNLRIGKALRLCPNDEILDQNPITENDQKKEKLLARYVYNSNLLSVDGIGDPDFGTPV